MRFKKVYIEISNICNLSCSFCFESSLKAKIMRKNSFEHILKEIKPAAVVEKRKDLIFGSIYVLAQIPGQTPTAVFPMGDIDIVTPKAILAVRAEKELCSVIRQKGITCIVVRSVEPEGCNICPFPIHLLRNEDTKSSVLTLTVTQAY